MTLEDYTRFVESGAHHPSVSDRPPAVGDGAAGLGFVAKVEPIATMSTTDSDPPPLAPYDPRQDDNAREQWQRFMAEELEALRNFSQAREGTLSNDYVAEVLSRAANRFG
jgi:hypothetical protein